VSGVDSEAREEEQEQEQEQGSCSVDGETCGKLKTDLT